MRIIASLILILASSAQADNRNQCTSNLAEAQAKFHERWPDKNFNLVDLDNFVGKIMTLSTNNKVIASSDGSFFLRMTIPSPETKIDAQVKICFDNKELWGEFITSQIKINDEPIVGKYGIDKNTPNTRLVITLKGSQLKLAAIRGTVQVELTGTVKDSAAQSAN